MLEYTRISLKINKSIFPPGRSEIIYNKKNKIDGEYLEFYYDGNIALKGYYILGFKDSIWTEFQPNKISFNKARNISFIKRYKNDLIILLN